MKPPFAPGRPPKPATLCLAILLGVGLSAELAFAQKRGELTDLEKVEQAEQRAEEATTKAGDLAEKAKAAERELETARNRREDAREEVRARKQDVDLLPESPVREQKRVEYREAIESRARAEERYRRALEAAKKAQEEAKKADENAGTARRRAKKVRAAYEAKFPAAPAPAPVPVAPPAEEPEILIEEPPEEKAPSPEMQDTPPVPPPAAAPSRKELEKQIKEAEKRAKRLEQEARDDDRRANSWRRRAEDAERIGRTELAEQNRRIADGFSKDAQRRREEAQKARTEATDARLKLADLKAGRPISPSTPSDAGAPAPPRPVPVEPDVPGLSEPPSPPQAVPQTGEPAPGGPPRPAPTPDRYATPNPFVTPTGPAVPGAPAQPVRPRAHCPIRNGTETNVRTFVRADPDNHDHTFCGQFQNALKRILFTGARDQFFVVAFEDVPSVLNCTAATPGSCDGRCEGRIPRLAGQENVAIEIRGLDFEWRTGKFVGDLVFYFPGGEFVVGFEGQAELPQSATPYPLVAAGGLALIVLGLFLRRPRRPGVESS